LPGKGERESSSWEGTPAHRKPENALAVSRRGASTKREEGPTYLPGKSPFSRSRKKGGEITRDLLGEEASTCSWEKKKGGKRSLSLKTGPERGVGALIQPGRKKNHALSGQKGDFILASAKRYVRAIRSAEKKTSIKTKERSREHPCHRPNILEVEKIVDLSKKGKGKSHN